MSSRVNEGIKLMWTPDEENAKQIMEVYDYVWTDEEI